MSLKRYEVGNTTLKLSDAAAEARGLLGKHVQDKKATEVEAENKAVQSPDDVVVAGEAPKAVGERAAEAIEEDDEKESKKKATGDAKNKARRTRQG